MTTLLNYTPHKNLAFVSADGERIPLPQAGCARAAVSADDAGRLDALGGVPLRTVSYGQVDDLPDAHEGVALVVSMLVVQLLPERLDLFYPDDLVRDADGTIEGFRALARLG